MSVIKQTSNQEALSTRALQHLRTTSRWVRFFGVIGFISSIFSLFGVFAAFANLFFVDDSAIPMGWSLLIAAIYIGIVAFSFYLSFVLFDYGAKTKQFVISSDYDNLAKSFKRQLAYWRIVGILTTLSLAFYLLYFISIIIIGTANNSF